MNQLLENILDVDAMIQSIETFIPIKSRIDSLDTNDPNYKTLVRQTDMLVRVLRAFSEV